MRRVLTAGLRPVLVVATAFLCSLTIFQLSGYQVGDVLQGAAAGSLTSTDALGQSLRWAIPLLLMALGVTASFRAGFFNVGAQGQMYVGAIVSLSVGLAGQGRLGWLFVPASIVAGCAAGGLWSLVSGVLRVFMDANEVVTTLMMNFVAILLLEWVASGPLKSPVGTGQAATTQSIAGSYRLSGSTGVSVTLIAVCCVMSALTWFLFRRTRIGLEMTLIGRNPVMARWQGIDPVRLGLLSFAFSGATAGLAGAIEVFGPAGSLQADFSPDVGLTAVVVALVGGAGVMGVIIAALFFGALRAATLYLPVVSDLPTSALDLLNGLVALLITVSALPKLRRRHRARTSVPPVPDQPIEGEGP